MIEVPSHLFAIWDVHVQIFLEIPEPIDAFEVERLSRRINWKALGTSLFG